MVGGICAADGLISNILASQETEYGWWYIENGGLYFNATGLAQNEYGWWYVRDSKVDFGLPVLQTMKWAGGMSVTVRLIFPIMG